MTVRTQSLVTASQLSTLLRGARKSLQLTQAQLAARVGLSQRRLSELEREAGTLSVDQLMALCHQLGLQVAIQAREPASSSADKHGGEHGGEW
jgi:HTH-type transcriptional regulator/antitoxin HipB